MRAYRFAVFGCGFWSQFQIAGWRELDGVELVAVYNRTREKAEQMAQRFGIPTVYDDAEALLVNEDLDFVDIITDVNTHDRFVRLAAAYRIPAICQKPMAPDLRTAEEMVKVCREADVRFMIHENCRWEPALRRLKHELDRGCAGRPFRARVTYSNNFPVFDNQPFLRELDHFILTDMGSHILDVARFLFGEAKSLYCQTRQVTPGIKGEDVATVIMDMGEGITVTCELSYASVLEHDHYPETHVLVECEGGSIELAPDYWVRVTEKDRTTRAVHCLPRHYVWCPEAYAASGPAIVACNANLLRALQSGAAAETSADDNLQTMRLVFAAYESSAHNSVITL